MKTPRKYIKNLERNVITQSMLSDCLYSVNKRAKNARDTVRERKKLSSEDYSKQKSTSIKYHEKKMSEYYTIKKRLLSTVTPTCIHKEFLGFEKERIYDYEYKKYKEALKDAVWQNSYFDYEKNRRVRFCDIEKYDCPKYQYYLYYNLGKHGFHSPEDSSVISEYFYLPIIEVGAIDTTGRDPKDLVSTQFVKEVLKIIEGGNYVYTSAS